jgi:uncharacterized protein (DUF924 family)
MPEKEADGDDRIADLIGFWRAAGFERWFEKDEAFDAAFRDRYLALHEAAARGDLDGWAESADGALALILLLDQFPRNAFRGTARMYATDPAALDIARKAVAAGFDTTIDPELRVFVYLPFEHSENLADQERCVALSASLGGEVRKASLEHLDIIQRFGRFPHRNEILGRETTPEEKAFLEAGGFSG